MTDPFPTTITRKPAPSPAFLDTVRRFLVTQIFSIGIINNFSELYFSGTLDFRSFLQLLAHNSVQVDDFIFLFLLALTQRTRTEQTKIEKEIL